MSVSEAADLAAEFAGGGEQWHVVQCGAKIYDYRNEKGAPVRQSFLSKRLLAAEVRLMTGAFTA